MTHNSSFAVFAAAAVSLVFGVAVSAFTSSPPYVPMGFSIERAEQEAGRQLFRDHCAACHAPRLDVRVILAPSLIGVVGRPAGSLPNFPYSEGLKKSGLVWTQDNLLRWIADGSHMIPNTLMPHVAITDPAERIYIVAYLKTLTGAQRGPNGIP